MAQDNILKALGLVTQYNALTTQSGALDLADDAVIRRENITENRRGHNSYATLTSEPQQVMSYLDRAVCQISSAITIDQTNGTTSNVPVTLNPPSGERMMSAEANGNLYFTTDGGVKVLESLTATTVRLSGAPRSLDPSVSLAAGSTGFLATGKNCAYRAVVKRTDGNGNTILGYPSTRVVMYNASGTNKNVSVSVSLAAEVTASDIIQVYRTAQSTSTGSDTAGDECALVYQVNPTSTDLTNKFISFTDIVDDSLRGASLYTSPSQESISQANDRPPLCKDLALYRSSYMLYLNTQTKQRLSLTMTGTGSLSGNTITLAGTTYKFGSTEIVSGAGSPQAAVSATGVAAVDIDLTARSLVRIINNYASNTSVYAYYTSSSDDLPGQILIEERGVGASAFTVTASTSGVSGNFFPNPPTSGTTAASTSTNDQKKNRLFYSKFQQLECVPATSYIDIGPSTSEALRVIALRDSAVIISESGVYRLSGDSPSNFTVQPLDLTCFCKAKYSVAALANNVMMLSNQGIVSINDTGVQVVSREIEPQIVPLLANTSSTKSYGIGYESERMYLISTVTNTSDTDPTQTFVYNVFTRAWTRWKFGIRSAIIAPKSDVMYLIKPSNSVLYKERKSFTDSDYADPDYSVTISSISGSTVTVSSTILPLIGWVITQNSTNIFITSVTDNGGGSYALTLASNVPATWTTSGATLTPAIAFESEYAPWSAAQPGFLKHVRQVAILSDSIAVNHTASELLISFKTDIDQTKEYVTIPSNSARWGRKSWGLFPWGGIADNNSYPTYVPMNKQYLRIGSFGVKHRRAFEKVSISGLSITFEMISERTSK